VKKYLDHDLLPPLIRGDYCAWIGARNTSSIFYKDECDHVKVVRHPNFKILVEDMKTPSDEASNDGQRFLHELGANEAKNWLGSHVKKK
jgi:hypothetical protein